MSVQSKISKHLLNRSVFSYLLYPFSILFSAFLLLRRFLYSNVMPVYKAPIFVISVGNVTIGGSGKTPFTIYLAGLLHSNSVKVAVSHRGYKSSLEGSIHLISTSDGLQPIADEAGDEAWLIAQRLKGIPVVTGKNRKKAIKLLCATYPDLECIILDDSFQHLKVRHNLDFVIVNEQIGFGNGFVLPAGYLREPASAIANADVIIRNGDIKKNCLSIKQINYLKKINKISFRGSYTADSMYDFWEKEVEFSSLKNTKAMLLSAIGNPKGFEKSISDLNIQILSHRILPDHFNYNDSDIVSEIVKDFLLSGAKWLITTEKDYAKLRYYKDISEHLLVLSISFKLDKQDDILLQYIMQKMKEYYSSR